MNTHVARQALRLAKRRGHLAFHNEKPYSANPYARDKTEERLAWSEGHNAAMVQENLERSIA